MKPISYKQETGDTERLLCPGGPHGVLLSFNFTFVIQSLKLSQSCGSVFFSHIL